MLCGMIVESSVLCAKNMEIFTRDGLQPGEICYYSVSRLWSIALEIDEVVRVKVDTPVLELKSWRDVHGNAISPMDVLHDLNNPLFIEHRLAIEAATFDYPILMNPSKTDCYDGMHRIAKARMLGRTYIDAKLIDDAQKHRTLVECIRPKIVHVSGSSGSGKSTLGRQLANKHVAVYDTDEFFQDAQMAESGFDDADDATKETIRDRYFSDGFETAMWDSHDKSVVVFVGLLDHASPSGRKYDKQPFDARFFLDVPATQLIKQYYKRVARELDDEEFLESVAPPNNTRGIPDSDRIYQWNVETRENHVQRGYELLTASQIRRRIEEMCK